MLSLVGPVVFSIAVNELLLFSNYLLLELYLNKLESPGCQVLLKLAQWLHDSILESNNTITHPTTGDQKTYLKASSLKEQKWNTMLSNHSFYSFLPIHESFRNAVWTENFVSLAEFLEENSVGEALSTDSNSLQHTITSQLLQHQGWVNFSSLNENNFKEIFKFSST